MKKVILCTAIAITSTFVALASQANDSPNEARAASGSSDALVPVSTIKRTSQTPILSPSAEAPFMDAGAFNPAAVTVHGKTVLLFRAQDKKGVSSVGYASSSDGIHFTADKKPVFQAEAAYELGGGVEDPRLQQLNGMYWLTYTGYNGKDAQLCLAKSKTLRDWQRVGIIMPAYQGSWNKKWTKSGAIVPTKINGKYWMYYLGTISDTDEMGVASSTDMLHWTDATKQPVLARRPGKFDSRVVEPGPAPLITDKGILLLYNGADDKLVYRTGWVLFDKKDPTHVLARSDEPILQPEKTWEKEGQVPNVVFVEGWIKDGNKMRLYYGGADKHTGVAELQLK